MTSPDEPEVFVPADYKEGQKVWVPHSRDAWDPAEVFSVSEDGKSLTLKAAQMQEFLVLTAAPKPQVGIVVNDEAGQTKTKYEGIAVLPPRDATSQQRTDLTTLSYLDEASILHNLHLRFDGSEIYTYTGPILVAINPWRPVPHLYTDAVIGAYADADREMVKELPPHIYAHGTMAFRGMMQDKRSQVVLVSGESGSGKTETCKLLLRYLTIISNRRSDGGKPFVLDVNVEKKIIDSNPILEALGNARTMHNPNSSRFGKFIEVQFDAAGRVAGAQIETYLLERGRVSNLGAGDRNFHVFYQILCGMEDDLMQRFGLVRSPIMYQYLSQGESYKVDGVDDKLEFFATMDAMDTLGISKKEKVSVLETIAMVLRLGNVVFVDSPEQGRQEVSNLKPEGGGLSSMEELEQICIILGLEAVDVATAMTQRTLVVRGESTVVYFNRTQALDARDAIARFLYSHLFDWVVRRINAAIHSSDASKATIALLDIFGFESLTINSFEQLCINYANEKLQQFFNNHIFKQEQKAYTDDHIEWTMVDFTDNMTVLDLIEGKPGILSILDEQCLVQHGSDRAFLDNIQSELKSNPHMKRKRLNTDAWVVAHYAGDVTYEPWGFLDKNRDQMTDELTSAITSAQNSFLKSLFFKSDYHRSQAQSRASMRIDSATYKEQDLAVLIEKAKVPGGVRQMSAKDKRASMRLQRRGSSNSMMPEMSNKRSSRGKRSGPSALQATTIGGRFKGQLQQLMGKVSLCYPYFIRCIKPNEVQKPDVWSGVDVARQLRSGGVVDAVKITRTMYPNHIDQLAFYRTYTGTHEHQCFLTKRTGKEGQFPALDETATLKQVRAKCDELVMALGLIEGDEYQLGRSRIFFRAGVTARLNQALHDFIAQCQMNIRACYLRWRDFSRYRDLRNATLLLQRVGRGMLCRLEYKNLREQKAASQIQKWFRTCRVRGVWESTIYLLKRRRLIELHQRREEERRLNGALCIQRSFKMFMAARRYLVLKRGIIRLQAQWRGKRVRRDNKIRKGGQLLEEKRRLERIVEQWIEKFEEVDKERRSQQARAERLELQVADIKEQKDFKEDELQQLRTRYNEELKEKSAALHQIEALKESQAAGEAVAAAEKSRLEEEVRFAKAEIASRERDLTAITSYKEGADQHGAQLASILMIIRGQLRSLRAQSQHDIKAVRLQVDQDKAEMTKELGEKLNELKGKVIEAEVDADHVREVLADTEEDMEELQSRYDRLLNDYERSEKTLFSERMVVTSLRQDVKKLEESLNIEKTKVVAGHSLYRQLEEQYFAALRDLAFARAELEKPRAAPTSAAALPLSGLTSATLEAGRLTPSQMDRRKSVSVNPHAGRIELKHLDLDVETLAAHSVGSEVKAGYLMSDLGGAKKGVFKKEKFQKVWCVMDSTSFSIYKDVTSKEPETRISLVDARCEFVEHADEHKILTKNKATKGIRDMHQVFLMENIAANRTYLFYDESMQGLEWVHCITDSIRHIAKLKEIATLAADGVDPRLAQFLIDSRVDVLDLSGIPTTPSATKCLALSFSMWRMLTVHTLSLRKTKLTPDQLEQVGIAIKEVPSLTALDLSANAFGDVGCRSLSAALIEGAGQNTPLQLKHLSLATCQIGDAGFQSIGSLLAVNPKMESLDVSGNKISDKGTAAFFAVLKETPWWTQARKTPLSKEEVDIVVARKQAGEDPVLTNPPEKQYCLRELVLSHNSIRDAEALGELLASTDMVMDLQLGHNLIEDAGALVLAKSLASRNASLSSLDVGSNPIGTEGAAALMEMLRTNHSLLSADFSELTVDGKKLADHLGLMARHTHVTCKSLKLTRAAAHADL